MTISSTEAVRAVRVLDVFALSDIGLERDHNEDSAVTSVSCGHFLVADGMGGLPAGEIASSLAAHRAALELKQLHASVSIRPDVCLTKAFKAADDEVRRHASADPRCRDMGTTLAAVVVDRKGAAWIAHVGDSRVYLYRGRKLFQLTQDHGFGHAVTRAIGVGPGPRPDVARLPLETGDVLLLCTDGLTKCVSHDGIATALRREGASCERVAEMLVTAALEGGGDDNVTVVVVRVG